MSHHTLLSTPSQRVAPTAVPIEALTKHWLDEGVITAEQAARIRDDVGPDVVVQTSHRPSSARTSLAVEALGYLGGVIAVVATMLITARYWEQISTTGRLALVGGTALVLVAAGRLIPGRAGGVGDRLRSVLWLAATAALAGFLGLLGNEVLDLADLDVFLMTSAGTAAAAAVLWSVNRSLLQQIAMAVTLMITAAAAIADFVTTDGLPGVGVWAVAAAWGLLGWRDLLAPRRGVQCMGAAGMVVGAMLTMPYDAGIVLALGTAALLVVLSLVMRDLILLGIGAVGALQVLPVMVNEWFPDTVAAPLALLAVGIVLVAVAIRIARHGGPGDAAGAARPTM
jgi:uncharacterized membrane protein